jgi:hypothetical protein
LLFRVLLLFITATDLSLGGSTDRTSKKIYINETIQKHTTNNTKHSKYRYTRYTYCQY